MHGIENVLSEYMLDFRMTITAGLICLIDCLVAVHRDRKKDKNNFYGQFDNQVFRNFTLFVNFMLVPLTTCELE